MLDILDPDGQGRTWSIAQGSDTETITWNVAQGNIGNVKIIGFRNFDSDPTDTFLITSSKLASSGFYNWNIKERSPSIIGSTVKYQVSDANTNYDIKDKSSANNTINGDVTITTPSVDWNVGDTSHDIDWVSYGDLGEVDVQFYNGTSWIDVSDSTSRPVSNDGANSFSVSNWVGTSAVPDVKTVIAQVRVRQVNAPNVTATSGTFNVYPTITNVVVTPTDGGTPGVWRSQRTNHTVSWDETSSKITSVDIIYSTSGSAGLPGAENLLTGGDDVTSSINGTNSATTIQVPYVITETAMLRVRDSDADFKDLVYKNSASFKIYGDIDFLAPLSSTNWAVSTPA